MFAKYLGNDFAAKRLIRFKLYIVKEFNSKLKTIINIIIIADITI